MRNATSFGTQAAHYAAARPTYPAALFDWIAAEAPERERVWDVGTGSGQAARALAGRFEQVHATDLDAAQLTAASLHPNVSYAQGSAHEPGLPADSVDAVTVATALHWFDFARFWPEVQRVARPGAVFAAWTYHRIEADADVMARLVEPVLSVIDPYWSEGNRLSWRGYPPDEIGFPFEPLTAPDFACELGWAPAQLTAFLRSWSAHARAREAGHGAQLERVEREAVTALGLAPRAIRLPLAMRAGRIA